MEIPDPDQGPGTPYFIANLLPATTGAFLLAYEFKGHYLENIDGEEFQVIQFAEIFILTLPFAYLVSTFINAIPSFTALKMLKSLGLANKKMSALFGALLPLFWYLLMLIIWFFSESAKSDWKEMTRYYGFSFFLLSITGALSGWLFMYLYEKKQLKAK